MTEQQKRNPAPRRGTSRDPDHVAIVTGSIQYHRLEFYNRLRATLLSRGVQLIVAHGRPSPHEQARKDSCDLEWGTIVENREIMPGRKASPVYQRAWGKVQAADLIIVTQAARRLFNYELFMRRKVGQVPRIGLWGHGWNHQPRSHTRLTEIPKHWLSQRADWWFAYTEGTAHFLASTLRYPSNRITIVRNSIDVESLSNAVDGERSNRRSHRKSVAYVGALTPEKKPILAARAVELARAITSEDIEIDFIGDGPEIGHLREFAASRRWIHLHGAVFGMAKARILADAALLLLPTTVGLSVLDGFAAGAPVLTFKDANHGPETSYLSNQRDSILINSPPDPLALAEELGALWLDQPRLMRMQRAALARRGEFSASEMADRFAGGVMSALAAPPLRSR
jgi:L-malate glycosyltransferase